MASFPHSFPNSDVLPSHWINKTAIIRLSFSIKGPVGPPVRNAFLDSSSHLYEGLSVCPSVCQSETSFFIYKIANFYSLRSGKKPDEVDFSICSCGSCETARGKRTRRWFAKLSHFQHRTYFIPGNEWEHLKGVDVRTHNRSDKILHQNTPFPPPNKSQYNTGHAVLRCTPKQPKMRRNGPTERQTDGRTDWRMDRTSYRGASQHLKNRKEEKKTMHHNRSRLWD